MSPVDVMAWELVRRRAALGSSQVSPADVMAWELVGRVLYYKDRDLAAMSCKELRQALAELVRHATATDDLMTNANDTST